MSCGDGPPPRTAHAYTPYASETYLAGPRDICIVTQYTSNQDVFASISADIHQAYAYEHGYKAYAFRGRISGDQFVDPGHSERLRRDGLYWQKVSAVKQVLERQDPVTHAPACRWVMWLDADAVFTNFNRSIDTVLSRFPGKDIILSREHFDTLINAGVYFVKNSPKGHAFLDAVAAMFPQYKNRELPEQMAMQDYAFDTRIPEPYEGLYDQVLPRLRAEIGIAPQRTFNSFAISSMSDNALYTWEPCDFVAHLAATKADARANRMLEMKETMTECAP